jgi:hypothetical protein
MNYQFLIFISVAITVYSLLNYYLIRKHKNLLSLGTLPSLLLKLVLVTVILTPIATSIFSNVGFTFLATITGFTGFSWLAFLFLFLMIHGTADIVLFATERFGIKPHPDTAKRILIFTLMISISILIYGRFEAEHIGVNEVTIKTDKLPGEVQKLTIAQISDVHFSSLTGVEKAQQLKNLIDGIKPDILVSTGDLLDRGVKDPSQVQAIIASITSPKAKYAIAGNHEYFYGINESIDFIQKSGFIMLHDKAATFHDIINIVGVDDPTHLRFGMKRKANEIDLLKAQNPDRFTLLLKHQPRVDSLSTPYFDLQLSGHTHAGQIFPFIFLVRMVFPYLHGLYDLADNAQIYVNRGTGTWGPPFRFLAPPEITVIHLQHP